MQTSLADEGSQLEKLPHRNHRLAFAASYSWFCLAIAAALLLFSNGANNVPLAAWLAPVVMLRFVRRQSFKTRGIRTIYSRLGDWFAWVCLLGLVLLTALSLRQTHS